MLPEIEALVFEPGGVPTDCANRSMDVPKMTPGCAALVALTDRYLAAMMDPWITLLEVHKLMYFLQAAGEPLSLRYAGAPPGPCAEDLREVLRDIEGRLIPGHAECGDSPEQALALVPGVVQEARAFLEAHPATSDRVDRVARLIEGFETPFGLELLSTVHWAWVAAREKTRDQEGLDRAVHACAPGKRQFTRAQIGLAADRLLSQGWWLSPVSRT